MVSTSRSILITAYLTYLTNFDKLSSLMKIDLKAEVFEIFTKVLNIETLNPNIFDMEVPF